MTSTFPAHGTAATGDTSSVALQFTATLPVYHPPEPSGPLATPVTTGALASRLMVTLRVVVPPSELAEQVKTVPLLFVDSVLSAHAADVMADSPSAAVHFTVTSPVYQPFLPSVPVTVYATAGGVLSRTTMVAGLLTQPHGGELKLVAVLPDSTWSGFGHRDTLLER